MLEIKMNDSNNAKNDFFEADRPVHKLSYCAFLDVLGFSDRIKESAENNERDKLLQEFHSIFKEMINQLEEETKDSLLYFKSFTDNVLLACPRFSEDMESEFGFILWSISAYQLQMSLHGFFIRGGLSIGPLFIDDNSVYGEALLEAYHLENKHANNPIVVLSDYTMKLVDKHVGYYRGMEAPQIRTLLVNTDGRYFINYLSECVIDTYEGLELDTHSLNLHKEQIENALVKYAAIPSVYAKFSWLSTYHNYFCNSVSMYSTYTDNLKIDSGLMSVKFKVLKSK